MFWPFIPGFTLLVANSELILLVLEQDFDFQLIWSQVDFSAIRPESIRSKYKIKHSKHKINHSKFKIKHWKYKMPHVKSDTQIETHEVGRDGPLRKRMWDWVDLPSATAPSPQNICPQKGGWRVYVCYQPEFIFKNWLVVSKHHHRQNVSSYHSFSIPWLSLTIFTSLTLFTAWTIFTSLTIFISLTISTSLTIFASLAIFTSLTLFTSLTPGIPWSDQSKTFVPKKNSTNLHFFKKGGWRLHICYLPE